MHLTLSSQASILAAPWPSYPPNRALRLREDPAGRRAVRRARRPAGGRGSSERLPTPFSWPTTRGVMSLPIAPPAGVPIRATLLRRRIDDFADPDLRPRRPASGGTFSAADRVGRAWYRGPGGRTKILKPTRGPAFTGPACRVAARRPGPPRSSGNARASTRPCASPKPPPGRARPSLDAFYIIESVRPARPHHRLPLRRG